MVSKTLVDRLRGAKEESPGTPTWLKLVGTDHALYELGVTAGWRAAIDLAVELARQDRFVAVSMARDAIDDYRSALDFAVRCAREFPHRTLGDAAPEERAIKAAVSEFFVGEVRQEIREEMRKTALAEIEKIEEKEEATARKDAGKPSLLDIATLLRAHAAAFEEDDGICAADALTIAAKAARMEKQPLRAFPGAVGGAA